MGVPGDAPDESRRRRGTGGYLVAGLLLILGISAGLAYGILRGAVATRGMHRIEVPGSVVLDLDTVGPWVVFVERAGDIREVPMAYTPPPGTPLGTRVAPSLEALEVAVTHAETGAPVPIGAAAVEERYDLGSLHGRSLRRLEIPAPGRYRVTARWPDGVTVQGAPVRVAVGRSLFRGIGEAFFGACGLVLLGACAAAALALVTWLRRARP